MLKWLVGRGSDEDLPEEPQTPAPVFAARAFRSALFGTPAVKDKDDDTLELAKAGNTIARETHSQSGSMSPTKRGILMTPGTATSRRKTVTFGANIEHDVKKESKSGIPDNCPGKFPSPWVSKSEEDLTATRRTNLLRTLENARETTKKPAEGAKDKAPTTALPQIETSAHAHPKLDLLVPVKLKAPEDAKPKKTAFQTSKTEDDDIDFTYDLDNPRSQSGKHWKREYEKYHEEAQERMGHLIRYKELAKSYAKLKDDEAMEMKEQLEREQQNVTRMESYIAKLMGVIEDRTKSGDSTATPELTKELSRQTALAVQYKEQVDEFRAALEKEGAFKPASTSSRTERALAEARRDLEKAREQAQEATSLRSEVKRLKLESSISERKATKLKEENLAMAQELEKCKADLRRSERERQRLEEQSAKRNDALQSLQKDYDALKQIAKKQRSDADLQLQQKQEQITALRNELRSTKFVPDGSESEELVRSLQQKINAHDKIVQEYEDQIAKLRTRELKELSQFGIENSPQKSPRRESYLRRVFGGSSSRNNSPERDSYKFTRDSLGGYQEEDAYQQGDETQDQDQKCMNVDHILEGMTPERRATSLKRKSFEQENPSKLPVYTRSPVTTSRSRQSILDDITNNSPGPTPRETEEPLTELSNFPTPNLSKRFSDLSLETPAISWRNSPITRICSPELPKHPANRAYQSPRPKMVNLERTPRSKQVSNLSHGLGSSVGRASSLSGKSKLPPERAAAAKARLEQRNREKRRKLQAAAAE